MTQLNAQALMAMPYEQMVACIKSWNRHKMEESRSWRFWRRNDQFEPEGDWRTWLVMAGRGYGKTRMGAEWVSALAAQYPGARFALVGATLNEARQVMVEGESGLLALPFAERPEWEPSLRRLTWRNGATATLFSAAEPESLRGPQHDFAWADEIAKWPNGIKAWDNLMLGLRLWNRSNGRDSIYTGGVWRSGPIIANPSGGAVVDTEARATLGAMLQYFRMIGVLTA